MLPAGNKNYVFHNQIIKKPQFGKANHLQTQLTEQKSIFHSQ